MADAPVVHIGENSPEKIAYELLICIANCEGKAIRTHGVAKANAERKWLLDTYAECLEATKGDRRFVKVAS